MVSVDGLYPAIEMAGISPDLILRSATRIAALRPRDRIARSPIRPVSRETPGRAP